MNINKSNMHIHVWGGREREKEIERERERECTGTPHIYPHISPGAKIWFFEPW